MGKKVIYFFSIMTVILNINCNKDRCNNSPSSYPINYLPLPLPYENWFSSISVSKPDSQTFYVAKSNDSLIQSFIQQFDNSYVPYVNWLTDMPEGSPCGNSQGSNRIFIMGTSLYPMSSSVFGYAVEFGIRYPGNPNKIEYYLSYNAYTQNFGDYYENYSIDLKKDKHSFIRVFKNDSLSIRDTINVYPTLNYKNYTGYMFDEVYVFNFSGSKYIKDNRYPQYIILSTKYGIVEYKEANGRIWSVSKI